MSKITGVYKRYVSCKEIFAKVKRDLSSFTSVGMIDDTEFPGYAMEVLSEFGNSVRIEDEAIVEVKDYKGLLPDNFNSLHAAYRCDKSGITKVPKKHLQNVIQFENDITYEILCRSKGCDIESTQDKTIEKIQVKQYFNEFDIHYNFDNIQLLRVSPNVKSKCESDCINLFATSDLEISFTDSEILTNFETGNIYLKFYGTPIDEDGYPLILDDNNLKKAVEWYIKYMIFLNLWENSSAPDMQSRWQKAEVEYEKWMAEARFITKLPTFQRTLNFIRNKRVINPVSLFSKIDRFR